MKLMNKRKLWYGLSLVIIVTGLVSLMLQGMNWGIDFTGGNVLQIEFKEAASTNQVAKILEDQELSGFSIQEAGQNGFLIRTNEISEEQSKQILTAFQDQLGELDIQRNQKIGAVIGRELTMNAVYALLIASILMIIYITFRFEFAFGIAAVLALMHDVLITVSLFSILQIEVDSAFVAALLTIIGYSINDTIVIFDRVRENLGLKKKESLEETVDNSINQTIVRSINTSLTVIFALVALLVLGGDTTKVFALALLVGAISGTYSSIFIASPIWFDLKKRALRKKVFKHASSH